VRAGLAFGIAMSCANEVVNFVFGVWLENQFNLQLAALGAASAVIGISELSGEGLSTLFVDRIGKPLSIRIGLACSVIASGWLYFFSSTPVGALSGLFLFYIGFEFTIVSSLPLLSGLYTQARATLMALAMASFSIGRAVGALLSPWLYQWDFLANLIAAILLNGLAFVCLLWMKPSEE
jgi:predicted MFS family arabinose efflux permease